MKEYLLRVIGTVLVCSLITVVSPEGKMSPSIKGTAKLICILAIIAPILSYFKTGALNTITDKNRQDLFFETGIETDGGFIQYYSEIRVRQAEETLQKELYEKYELKSEVTLVWRLVQDIQIERICIKLLENTDEEVKMRMQRYLTENYCSEVLIE